MTTKSSRTTPNQFAQGLDISGTRMQADLQALAGRLNNPLPADIARRWVETHLTAGFLPSTIPVPAATFPGPSVLIPQPLPWMGSYNSASSTTAPIPSPIANTWRQKGTSQKGIQPAQGDTDLLSWEQSFGTSKPCVLDKLQITMATDSVYANDFKWGPGAHRAGATDGDPLTDITVQVLIDSALASEDRTQALAPVLVRNFPANTQAISMITGTVDGMIPHTVDLTVPQGLCIVVYPRQPIPENARIRVILTIPLWDKIVQFPGTYEPVDGFGYLPANSFVLSSHVTLLEPIE